MLQLDVIIIILRDIGKHILDGIEPFVCNSIITVLFVKMFFYDRSKNLVQIALNFELISGAARGEG